MLGIILIYFVVLILIIGFGTGVGFLLHWIMSAVELGIGILIGVVATCFSLDLLVRFLNSYDSFLEDEEMERIIPKPGRFRRSSRRRK